MGLLPTRTAADKYGVNAYCAEYEAYSAADSKRVERMKRYRQETDRAREPRLLSASLTGAPPEVRDYGHARRTDLTERHDIPLPLAKALNVKHDPHPWPQPRGRQDHQSADRQ